MGSPGSPPHDDREGFLVALIPPGRLSALAFVILCGLPYLQWVEHPSLFDDDFLRVGSLRRSNLGEALFRPFNEHMAPLFETVSWLAWQGAGRRIQSIPMAFQVASFAFGVTVGLLAALIRRELRSTTASLVAVAVFCLSSVSSETVLWYSASSFQWAASATLASWLAASIGRRRRRRVAGGPGWLVGRSRSLAAPAFSAIGVLAAPLAGLRLLVDRARPESTAPATSPGRSSRPRDVAFYLLICERFRYREVVSATA